MKRKQTGRRPPSRRAAREAGELESSAVSRGLAAVLQRYQAGQLPEALSVCRQVVQQHPHQAEPLHLLGRLLYQAGHLEAAEESLRSTVRLAPNYAAAWNDLGNVCSDRGDWAAAATAYRQALVHEPDLASAHNNLGLVYKHEDQWESAIAAFNRALQLRPEDADAWHNLGTTWKRLGRYEEAATALRRVIELAPERTEAYQDLCGVLRSAGRTDDARDALDAWLRRDPSNPVPQHLRAGLGGATVPSRASDNYVREVFDRFAETFDQQLTQLQYRGPELIAAALAEHLGEPRGQLRILDAGCGTGLCGAALRPYARQLAGVDLSVRMLDHARQRRCYDALDAAELTAYLDAHPARWEVIVACDTFNYFGELQQLLSSVAGALAPGGTLIFTLEHDVTTSPSPGFHLNPTGRYSHTPDYLRRSLEWAQLALRSLAPVTLRQEAEQPVAGLLAAAVAGRDDACRSA